MNNNSVSLVVSLSIIFGTQTSCLGAETPLVAPVVDNTLKATINAQVERQSYTMTVEIENDICSSTVHPGDIVTAKMTEDCHVEDIQIDESCTLKGHIENVVGPRSGWRAFREKERRFKKGGSFLIVFDTLVMGNGKSIPVEARIGAQKALRCATPEQKSVQGWREVQASKNGTIVKANDSFSPTKRKTIGAVNALSSVATMPLGFVPGILIDIATSAAIGAATATGSDKDANEGGHPRVRGFINGAIGSLPPVKIVRLVALRGADTTLKRGDKLDVELSFK